MKIISYYDPELKVGALIDGSVVDLRKALVIDLIRRERTVSANEQASIECPGDMARLATIWNDRQSELRSLIERTWREHKAGDGWLSSSGVVREFSLVRILPPVIRPSKIVAIGAAYEEHVRAANRRRGVPESEIELPTDVKISFFKPPSCLVADGAIVQFPGHSDAWDCEGELAVVIGKRAQGISAEDAMDYVFGFTILNDISDRDVSQLQGGRTSPTAKGRDGYGPLGPGITLREEIGERVGGLAIKTMVNGEIRQDARTTDLLWSVEEMIARTSEAMTLLPGDIITTGSPPGTGVETGKYLEAGDVIQVSIEGLGVLTNTVGSPI